MSAYFLTPPFGLEWVLGRAGLGGGHVPKCYLAWGGGVGVGTRFLCFFRGKTHKRTNVLINTRYYVFTRPNFWKTKVCIDLIMLRLHKYTYLPMNTQICSRLRIILFLDVQSSGNKSLHQPDNA